MNSTSNIYPIDRIPFAEIRHAADGVCRSRGWHSNECTTAQTNAQNALMGIGLLLAVAALVYAVAFE